MIKVAINGYGTIGKRVADAISAQENAEIIGVTSVEVSIEYVGECIALTLKIFKLFKKSKFVIISTIDMLINRPKKGIADYMKHVQQGIDLIDIKNGPINALIPNPIKLPSNYESMVQVMEMAKDIERLRGEMWKKIMCNHSISFEKGGVDIC